MPMVVSRTVRHTFQERMGRDVASEDLVDGDGTFRPATPDGISKSVNGEPCPPVGTGEGEFPELPELQFCGDHLLAPRSIALRLGRAGNLLSDMFAG